MTAQLPRIALVLLVAASLTVALAGARAISEIIGPTVLALVLTITVHPLRRRLVRRGMPEWLVSLIAVVSVYLLLLGVTVSVIYSIGRLAALIPAYTADIDQSVADLGDWLEELGMGEDQIAAMAQAVDVGSLLDVATNVFGAALGLVSNLFFIVTVALFMAFDTGSLERGLTQLRAQKPDLVGAISSFAHGTRTYMGVSAGFGLIVAVIDGVVLYLMGVPGAFVWAVLAFVTNFIPNIGFVIGVIPPAFIGLLEGGPSLMLAVIVGLLRDQLRDPVDHPAAVRRRRGGSHADHHDAVPGLLGLGLRGLGRPPGSAAEPADAGAAHRGGPRRQVGAATRLRAAASRDEPATAPEPTLVTAAPPSDA